MGFFYEASSNAPPPRSARKVIPIELMKEHGCAACSFNVVDTRRLFPKAEPQEVDTTAVYLLGSSTDLESDRPFTREQLRDIVAEMPDSMLYSVGAAVRCAPLPGDTIDLAVSLCCSKYADASIARTAPKLVLGFGPQALTWALGFTAQESLWRGRRWPIKVSGHVCWYQHSMHPDLVALRQDGWSQDTEWMLAYRHDVRDAIKFARTCHAPNWIDKLKQTGGVVCIDPHAELAYDEFCHQLEMLTEAPLLGVDIETNGFRPYHADMRILTIAISDGQRTVALPVDHPRGWPATILPTIKKILVDFLLNSGEKIAHHLAFEMEWFCYVLSPLLARRTEWGDSYAAAHTIDERQGGKSTDRGGVLSLGMVTLQQFGFDVKKLSNLDPGRILEYPLPDVLLYNGLDAKWCVRVYKAIWTNHLRHDDKARATYERKVRRIPTLVLSQIMGLAIDLDYARDMDTTLTAEIESAKNLMRRSIEVKAFESKLGRPFMMTPDDVVILVRDIMKLSVTHEKTGKVSSDESILAAIPKEKGIAPGLILKVRQAEKMKGTYIDPLLSTDPKKSIVYPDGRIHTNYNQMIAETGRLSSDDPNNQNWPKHKRKEIRGVIVCEPDDYMIACDYGQIEARCVAMLSEDANLVDALWTSFDIHGHWADRFIAENAVSLDWIADEYEIDRDDAKKLRKELRQCAKNMWVFPLFFGSSHKSCARNLHMDLDIAEDLKREFWAEYAGVLKWQNRTKAFYEKHLYVETGGGNRRHGLLSVNQIINTPIQGTAAEIVLDRMCALSEYAEIEEKPHFQPPLNVHDDLTFSIPADNLEDDVDTIARIMCDFQAPYVNVPIVVEVLMSYKRWHELKEVGVWRSDKLGYHTRRT